MSRKLLTAITVAILTLMGCGPRIEKPTQICPGAGSAVRLLSELELHLENAVPLRANGQCLLRYYADGKRRLLSFPVKLWLNPPVEIYLQGDVAFDPRGIVVGSNEREFWLCIKPSEINSYWWGRWAEHKSFGEHALSPRILLEVLGIAAVGGEADTDRWSLSKEDAFDLLVQRNDEGAIIKKIYVDSCNGLVWKIEYFDVNGEAVAAAELYKYKEISAGFSVPTVIKVVKYAEGKEENSVRIVLGSVRVVELTGEKRRRLFDRPKQKGFKNIKKI